MYLPGASSVFCISALGVEVVKKTAGDQSKIWWRLRERALVNEPKETTDGDNIRQKRNKPREIRKKKQKTKQKEKSATRLVIWETNSNSVIDKYSMQSFVRPLSTWVELRFSRLLSVRLKADSGLSWNRSAIRSNKKEDGKMVKWKIQGEKWGSVSYWDDLLVWKYLVCHSTVSGNEGGEGEIEIYPIITNFEFSAMFFFLDIFTKHRDDVYVKKKQKQTTAAPKDCLHLPTLLCRLFRLSHPDSPEENNHTIGESVGNRCGGEKKQRRERNIEWKLTGGPGKPGGPISPGGPMSPYSPFSPFGPDCPWIPIDTVAR